MYDWHHTNQVNDFHHILNTTDSDSASSDIFDLHFFILLSIPMLSYITSILLSLKCSGVIVYHKP